MLEPDQEEISLPKATVQKIVGEILPDGYSFTKDAREALIECCIEFLMIVSTESNDIADRELKKTISTDHVLAALKNLGFGEYLPTLFHIIDQFKISSKIREKKIGSKFRSSGLSEEELLRKQEELFKASRDKLRQQNN